MIKMKLLFDEYAWKARFFPCIISILPLLVLWGFLSENVKLRELWTFLYSIKFYGGATISLVFLYFYAQIIRIASKYFENKYFIKKLGFPTTYLMTYADKTFSENYKDKYRQLAKKHFDFDLLNKDEELRNPTEAQKRLNETTKQVILKIKDGQLVKKQNIWYGFVRNLIGGTIFSVIFCIINIIAGLTVHKSCLLVIFSVILLVVYGGVFLFHKSILRQNAEAYATQLISEFISLG